MRKTFTFMLAALLCLVVLTSCDPTPKTDDTIPKTNVSNEKAKAIASIIHNDIVENITNYYFDLVQLEDIANDANNPNVSVTKTENRYTVEYDDYEHCGPNDHKSILTGNLERINNNGKLTYIYKDFKVDSDLYPGTTSYLNGSLTMKTNAQYYEIDFNNFSFEHYKYNYSYSSRKDFSSSNIDGKVKIQSYGNDVRRISFYGSYNGEKYNFDTILNADGLAEYFAFYGWWNFVSINKEYFNIIFTTYETDNEIIVGDQDNYSAAFEDATFDAFGFSVTANGKYTVSNESSNDEVITTYDIENFHLEGVDISSGDGFEMTESGKVTVIKDDSADILITKIIFENYVYRTPNIYFGIDLINEVEGQLILKGENLFYLEEISFKGRFDGFDYDITWPEI